MLWHWEANQLNNKGVSNYLYIVLTSNKSLKQCDDLKSSFPQSDAHSHAYIYIMITPLEISIVHDHFLELGNLEVGQMSEQ